MPIDIRATVTCTVGGTARPLISGSISDDYLQGAGLIKTRGECELKGLYTPAPGTVVLFSWTKANVTTTIPRRLLVLSSFADPYRLTTKVQLGCRLTYMEGVGPAPATDVGYTTGAQIACRDADVDYPSGGSVPVPVKAKGVMNICLEKLSLTATSSPLTNVYFVDEFDLSGGYVNVLGNLLVSESYAGYINSSGNLALIDLSSEGGTGKAVDRNSIVDIGPIGVGELPGDAIAVPTQRLKLNNNIDPNDFNKRDFEEEEVIGSPTTVYVGYTDQNTGETEEKSFSYVPYTKTTTYYGDDLSFNDQTCIITTTTPEGPDLRDKVVRRVTEERILFAEAAGSYCTEAFGIGNFGVPAPLTDTVMREVLYDYDNDGEVSRSVSRTYEPFFKWASGLNIPFVYAEDGGTTTLVQFPISNGKFDKVLTEEVVVEYTNVYAPKPYYYKIRPYLKYEPVLLGQKVKTTTFQNFALSPQGQQAIAVKSRDAPFASATEALDWLVRSSKIKVLSFSEVLSNRGRVIGAGQGRPGVIDEQRSTAGETRNETAEIVYATGSAQSERIVTYSMPYQSDDYYTAAGAIVRGDAKEKALKYGRTQNRLLNGNRYGASLQLDPAKMPSYAFEPIFVSDGGVTVLYRANGINWAFSSDGVIGSVDAMYWGVAGGTGTSWVPVAPGVTGFPSAPAVTSGQSTVSSVVPPWNETVKLEAVAYTSATVKALDYVLGSVGTESVALVTRAAISIPNYFLALATGSCTFTGQAANFVYTRRVAAGVGAFTLTGLSSGSVRNYGIGTNVGTFTLSGAAAGLVYSRLPLMADAAAFTVTGQDAALFKAIPLVAEVGNYTLTGQAAGSVRNYALAAAAGSYTLTGQTAGLIVAVTDPSFSSVGLLLHMDGSSGSSTFTDSSGSGKTVTVTNATINTSVKKYGTGSGSFNGTSAYLRLANNTDWAFGSGDFTFECWVNWSTLQDTILGFHGYRVANEHGWSVEYSSASILRFSYSTSGANVTNLDVTWSPSTSTWYHVAVCRSGNTLRFFVDGTKVGTDKTLSATIYDPIGGTPYLFIGAFPNMFGTPIYYHNGYLDDVRITKGVARYTANFTAPTAAFPDS